MGTEPEEEKKPEPLSPIVSGSSKKADPTSVDAPKKNDACCVVA